MVIELTALFSSAWPQSESGAHLQEKAVMCDAIRREVALVRRRSMMRKPKSATGAKTAHATWDAAFTQVGSFVVHRCDEVKIVGICSVSCHTESMLPLP